MEAGENVETVHVAFPRPLPHQIQTSHLIQASSHCLSQHLHLPRFQIHPLPHPIIKFQSANLEKFMKITR